MVLRRFVGSTALIALVALVAPACGSDSQGDDDDDVVADAGVGPDGGGEIDPWGCADVFSQNLVPTYEIEIDQAEWDGLIYDYNHRAENIMAGLDPKPYHPIEFRYGAESYPNAMIRLKGSFSWNPEITDKMQFVVSFNEVSKDGRFHGQRKLVFDAPFYDETFLHERVALSYMRDLGVGAGCANSARLVFNGDYYGLYTQLERIDHEFLERVYPDDPDGDLWKNGVELHNNDTSAGTRRELFFDAASVSELEMLADLDQSVMEWAGEATVPHGDGFWGLSRNYYLYDHATRGFVFIPFDMDASFEWTEYYADPVTWTGFWVEGPSTVFLLVMDDPTWYGRYIDDLEAALDVYDVDVLSARIIEWGEQIADAVDADPNKPFTTGEWEDAVRGMRDYVGPRAIFMRRWLDCNASGEGEDADMDGYVFCNDCDDTVNTTHPGADDVCGNDVDDDCDGRRDEGCP